MAALPPWNSREMFFATSISRDMLASASLSGVPASASRIVPSHLYVLVLVPPIYCNLSGKVAPPLIKLLDLVRRH